MSLSRVSASLALCLLGACSPVGDGGEDLAPPPDLAPKEVRYDWVQIIGTGQSLSVGVAGGAVLSRQQPYGNLKLADSGPDPKYPLNGGGALSLVPLVEPVRPMLLGYGDSQYPNNIHGESPHGAMANQITAISLALTGKDYVSLHSVVGWSGHPIVDINKQGSGRAYPGSLSEARTFKRLADAAGKSFAVGAIVLTHGESDAGNMSYGAQLYKLWQDYNADLKAITGQTKEDVPLLLSQQSTFGDNAPSTQAQWQAGALHPGEIICVGPKYQYDYAPDRVHFDAVNYLRLGEKYAQVYYQTVVRGQPFRPLQPRRASLSGAVITVELDVPVPPLAWDEAMPAPHQTANTAWKNGRGFEVLNAGGPLTIEAVQIAGSTVQIRLAAAPGPMGLQVRYAMIQDGSGAQGGTPLGHLGQLRDSDPFVGRDAQTLRCAVTAGSATIRCPGALPARARFDLVAGAGVPAGTFLAAKVSADEGTLSKPWGGQTGMADLAFHHEQRNFLVQFALPVN